MVIYLGGGSQRGDDLNKLKGYGIPFYVEQGHEYGFIIASPDDKYWTTENWFESFYAELTSKYRIDITRIYVTGISIGGFGTWQVAMDYPDKFAAIVPLCGGVNDSDTANISRLKELPIWTFHGTMDDMIPISETEKVVSKLEEYGHINSPVYKKMDMVFNIFMRIIKYLIGYCSIKAAIRSIDSFKVLRI